MKVYMFYINKNRFKELFDIGYIPSEIPVVRDMLLYAYTKNKNIANSFIEMRCNDFILSTVEMDKSDYNKFKSKHSLIMLSIKDIANIPVTTVEMDICNDICASDVNEDLLAYSTYPYDIFKDEYEKYFDCILYTYYNVLSKGSESDIEMVDNSLLSYNITPCGYYRKISISNNIFNIFINVYKNLFK